MLPWVKTFLAVYRTGSVTNAALAVHLTQPTVSQHLRGLEAHLGRALFERLPRGVVPTRAAHDLARLVGPHLELIEASVEAARAGSGGRATALVRLGGPSDLLSELVIPAIAGALDPALKLRVQVGLADELLEQLRTGELDLVVATARVHKSGLEYERMIDEEFVLVAGRAWAERIPARAVEARGAAALEQVPLVAFGEQLPIVRRYWRVVFDTRPRSVAVLVAPDLRMLRAAVAAGAGITVLPRYLIETQLAAGQLVQLVTPATPPRNTIHLATRTGALSGGAAIVRELLRRVARFARD